MTNRKLTKAVVQDQIAEQYDHLHAAALEAKAQEIFSSLRPNQIRFCEKAIREGYAIDFSYSGRCMFGSRCPSIVCDSAAEFGFKGASIDNMGLQYVIYMP